MKISSLIFFAIIISEPLMLQAMAADTREKTELQADIFIAKGEFDQAAEVYRELLEKSPEDYRMKFKMAELLSWGKKYHESVQVYQELLTQFPDDNELRRKYAMVLMWMGEEKDAAEQLEKTLK
jgi:thioredoxin-like negative regulator of GroEL